MNAPPKTKLQKVQSLPWCRIVTYAIGALNAWIALTGTDKTKQTMVLAAVMSGVWVYWYGYDYRTEDQIRIGRFNVMTWVVWVFVLVFTSFVYARLKSAGVQLRKRIAIIGTLWVTGTLLVEWIGYNVCDIALKSNYPGLFGMKLMHGPWYLKVYYLTVWVAFLTLLNAW